MQKLGKITGTFYHDRTAAVIGNSKEYRGSSLLLITDYGFQNPDIFLHPATALP
jgi:hypothetical protein